jgi:hypothetical protein
MYPPQLEPEFACEQDNSELQHSEAAVEKTSASQGTGNVYGSQRPGVRIMPEMCVYKLLGSFVRLRLPPLVPKSNEQPASGCAETFNCAKNKEAVISKECKDHICQVLRLIATVLAHLTRITRKTFFQNNIKLPTTHHTTDN